MCTTSPSVTDVVQTFSWLFGSHEHPLTRQRVYIYYVYNYIPDWLSFVLSLIIPTKRSFKRVGNSSFCMNITIDKSFTLMKNNTR